MGSNFTGTSWYKGALHCHTSMSDGHVPPHEMLKKYREHGYSFAALTDHDYFAHYPEADSSDFISLPGAEIIFQVNDFNDNIRGTHIVALAGEPGGEYATLGAVRYEHQVDCEGMNRHLAKRSIGGNSLILAHPYWSYMDFADVLRVENYFAVEVFNALCRLEGNSDGLAYWDYLLRRGKKIFGVAVDDHHSMGGDFAAGWVCVKANKLNRNDIFASLLAGNFYSSTGPEITDFGVEDGKVFLRCKTAKLITFTAFGEDCWPIVSDRSAESVEYGEYQLTGREKYVRAEVVGFDGNRAWTNPLFF
jgi:hypothetical protein